MMKKFKIHLKNITIKLILIFIILSFIFTTISSYMSQSFEKNVAIINGEKISLQNFQNMYFINLEKQKKILGNQTFFQLAKDPKFLKNIHDKTMSQLIDNILLEQYTEAFKIQTKSENIDNILLNTPDFQINHTFNKEKYLNYLKSINVTNDEYLDIIKKKINTEYLINTISNTDFILEYEKKNIVHALSQTRTIKKALLKIDDFIKKQKVKKLEIIDYFNKNKNNLYYPEQFKLNFIKLQPNNFQVKCNKKEIDTWYLNNIQKYSNEEKRNYSIIQIQNKQNAFELIEELKKKPDLFSKIAQEHSIDPISSKNHGNIGWISVKDTPKEIKEANLNKINQISSIIPFNKTFIIVKLNNIIEKKPKKLYEVYDLIQKEITTKKSFNLYMNFQDNVYKTIKHNPEKLNILLKKNNFFTIETKFFDKNSIPDVLNHIKLKKVIFNKKFISQNKSQPNTSIELVKFPNHFFLISLKAFKEKKMQNINEAKNKIIHNIKFIKAIHAIKEHAKNIVIELKQGKNNLFKKCHLHFSDSENIAFYDTNPIKSIIFSLPQPKKNEKIFSLYQDQDKNMTIILFENVQYSNFSETETNIISEYLQDNYSKKIFQNILNNIRKKASITYEKK